MILAAAWVLVVAAGPFPSWQACEDAKPVIAAPMSRYECVGGPAPMSAPLPMERPKEG